MKFVVICIVSLFILTTSGNIFDWPLGGNVRPVYRRLKSDGLRQIYQAKELTFDPVYQKANGVPGDHPSVYYDAAWPDWRQNSLQKNIQDSILLPWSRVTVSTLRNPIALGEPDPFAEIFKNKKFIKSSDSPKDNWKIGPVEVFNGQIRFII